MGMLPPLNVVSIVKDLPNIVLAVIRHVKTTRFKKIGTIMSDPVNPYDAYTPKQMAARVEAAGIFKGQQPFIALLTLAVLAGAFIAFGAMFYTMTITGTDMGLGPKRLLGGVAFSLGLVLVVVGGAELFTGNALMMMAYADKRVSTGELLRNWVVVYVGNFIGAAATAVMVSYSGILETGGGAVAETARNIAMGKAALPFEQAFLRGMLCNALVCLAVWLTFAARDVAGKILAILFPITAFVALGFEHSIANMYLIPVGILAGADVSISQFVANLVPVTLGNIVGGSVLVALVYWLIYVRQSQADS